MCLLAYIWSTGSGGRSPSNFYRATLRIAWTMLSQDVYLSVTLRYCVKTAKHMIKILPSIILFLFKHDSAYPACLLVYW